MSEQGSEAELPTRTELFGCDPDFEPNKSEAERFIEEMRTLASRFCSKCEHTACVEECVRAPTIPTTARVIMRIFDRWRTQQRER